MADVIQIRRDTATLWTNTNPVLASGEFGYETDTTKIKIGDGSTAWTSLGYYTLGTLGYAPLASPTFTGTVTGPTINASTALQIGGTAVTSTAVELNILDGVTATTAELNYVDGVTSNIQTQLNASLGGPSFDAVASGAIANGDTVIINANGTVSSVAGTGASESIGADTEFESGGITGVKGCYDTSTDRVILTYKEGTDNYVVAKVGQVSGTSISWGAETRIGTQNSNHPDICYDSNANRVVVFYQESASVGTDHGYCAVGTVTGGGTNTISFGSTVAIEAAPIRYTTVRFDASTNNVVFLWQQDGSPNEGEARCGTVNTGASNVGSLGTKIEFSSNRAQYLKRGTFYDPDSERIIACYQDNSNDGQVCMIENTTGTTLVARTTVEFEAGQADFIAACYDTNQNKGIVMWRDSHDGYYLKAMVLTIVGGGTNSITLGTEVTAIGVNSTQIGSGFDQTSNKVVVLYDDDPAAKGKVVTGTISGTGGSATSTWDTPLSLDIAYVQYPDSIYDPDTGQSILCYVDGSDSESGHARALTVGYADTNLTTENYIGISKAAYSNTQTATIQIAGAVDDAQSSLTPGQTYYISFDGSLSLTPLDVPAVTAGTAVAATKLIVKG